jgi:hypothetical protein
LTVDPRLNFHAVDLPSLIRSAVPSATSASMSVIAGVARHLRVLGELRERPRSASLLSSAARPSRRWRCFALTTSTAPSCGASGACRRSPDEHETNSAILPERERSFLSVRVPFLSGATFARAKAGGMGGAPEGPSPSWRALDLDCSCDRRYWRRSQLATYLHCCGLQAVRLHFAASAEIHVPSGGVPNSRS